MALASRNHFGKKEKEKKRSLAPSFTYFFPFLFFLFQAFNSYPAWKNITVLEENNFCLFELSELQCNLKVVIGKSRVTCFVISVSLYAHALDQMQPAREDSLS